jgi:hypothetical protein
MSSATPQGCLVLVCGGRDYSQRPVVFHVLDEIHAQRTIRTLCHGACGVNASKVSYPKAPAHLLRGADRWAQEWSDANQVPVVQYPAMWSFYGPSAGPRRNYRMLREFKPDLVVAFPGGRGTAGMVEIARHAGVEVVEIKP